MGETKTCRGCDVEQPLDGFYRRAAAADGRDARCKTCWAADRRRRLRGEPSSRDIAASHRAALLAAGLKHCGGCGQDRPVEGFAPSNHTSDRLNTQCRDCVNRYSRERLRRDPAFRARKRTLMARWVADNPERHRENMLRKNYGIGLQEWDDLFERQGGVCAICGQPSPTEKRLAVDHDHAHCPGRTGCKGCVRGLLCQPCNHAIGFLSDSTELLRRAIDYLEEHRVTVAVG